MNVQSPSIGTPKGLGLADAWWHLRAAVRIVCMAAREAARRARTRRHLTELDAHLLRDIGVTAANASVEANKPFWRA